MTDLRGWALAEQHLVPDAIVAFVDGELSVTAQSRARAHLARCPLCATEAKSQHQARAAVRAAESPSVPPGLLNSLRSIPEDVDLGIFFLSGSVQGLWAKSSAVRLAISENSRRSAVS